MDDLALNSRAGQLFRDPIAPDAGDAAVDQVRKPVQPSSIIAVSWTVLEANGGCAAPAKVFGVGEDGAPVVKGKGTQPARSMAERRSKRGTSGEILADLGRCVEAMTCRHVLVLAPPPVGKDAWPVVPKDEAGDRGDVIYRGNRHFPPVHGPALFGLDFDVKAWPAALRRKIDRTRDGLMGALRSAFPAFANVAYLQRPSSSAGIRAVASGVETPADAGVHMFLVVRNGEDVERFVKALDDQLVADGFGYHFVTENGVVLVRSIIDRAASGLASRLWFEGKAILGEGLELVPGGRTAILHNPTGHFLDTRTLKGLGWNVDTDPLAARLDSELNRHQQAGAIEAATKRRAYRERRAADLVARRGMSETEANKIVGIALERHVLCGDFDVTFDDGSGATIREILADRPEFHKKTMPDPLEPEYGAGRNLAICYTDGAQPRIWSQAHGGIEYFLQLDPADWFEEIATTEPAKPDVPSSSTAGLFGDEDDSDLPTVPVAPAKRMRFETFGSVADAALSEGAQPLVRGLLDANAMTVLYGESNSGKSFVALDIAYHIATGLPWADLPVTAGTVVYIAAEGGRGVAKRAQALRLKYGPAPRFHFLRSAIDLLHPNADLHPLLETLLDMDEMPSLIIVDTLSRVMAGGEENSSVDMTNLVRNLDVIRFRVGCHLLVVHHSGKNRAKGARGHSSLRAATDTEIEIADAQIAVTKQRDIEKGFKAPFTLEPVTLGLASDGEPVSSATVRVLGVVAAPAGSFSVSEADYDRRERIALAALTAMDGKTEIGSATIHDRLADELEARALTKGKSAKTIQSTVIEVLKGDGVEVRNSGQVVRLIARKSTGLANAPWILRALTVPKEAMDKLSVVGNSHAFE